MVGKDGQLGLWDVHLEALGAYIREQRRLSDLSLRDLAARTSLSNAYLSQLERGMNEPSLSVIRAIAVALDLPVSTLLARMGLEEEKWGPDLGTPGSTEAAIRADIRLTPAQKDALLGVYRSYVAGNAAAGA